MLPLRLKNYPAIFFCEELKEFQTVIEELNFGVSILDRKVPLLSWSIYFETLIESPLDFFYKDPFKSLSSEKAALLLSVKTLECVFCHTPLLLRVKIEC